MTDEIKEKIAWEVIRTLVTRFDSFPENAANNRNAPFHEAFLKAFADKLEGKVSDIPFFISLSSWLHGLNTTLGQSFFENIAHILSGGEKREYTSKKLGNLTITKSKKAKINQIITQLSNGQRSPSLEEENRLIFDTDFENDEKVNALDFSADVFFEDEDKIVAIELKTVKPNSGEMRGEKHKILEGKAALFNLYQGRKEVLFYIGFPFDPTSDEPTSFNKTRFLDSIINMTKFFDPKETLVARELWDLLAGEQNTMVSILKIINTISTTQFLKKYRFLNNTKNREYSKERYIELLREWFLFSEINLIENDFKIYNKIKGSNRLIRLYNQKPFNEEGKYNFKRYSTLIELVSNNT